MYYAKEGSKCVHATPNCKRSRIQNAERVEFNINMRKCKFCFPPSCMICFNTYKYKCPCKIHTICEDCLLKHIHILIQNPVWDKVICCPCGEGQFNETYLSSNIKDVINTLVVNKCDYKRSDIDIAIQDILTSKCKHCKSAFLDFDGCLSLQCRCKKFFCALCLHVDDSSEENHKHVINCKWNPNKKYYLKFEEFKAIEHKRKFYEAWKFCINILLESESIMYTIGIIIQINKYNNALIPYMSNLSLNILFFMHHIVLYCLFGFKYILYFLIHQFIILFKILRK